MPSSEGQRGRPFRDHRQVVEGIIYRFRTGVAWRDLPESFGPWQTVVEAARRFSADGTWDKIHTRLLAEADAAGEIDWNGLGRLHDQPGPPARHHVSRVEDAGRRPASARGAESNYTIRAADRSRAA